MKLCGIKGPKWLGYMMRIETPNTFTLKASHKKKNKSIKHIKNKEGILD